VGSLSAGAPALCLKRFCLGTAAGLGALEISGHGGVEGASPVPSPGGGSAPSQALPDSSRLAEDTGLMLNSGLQGATGASRCAQPGWSHRRGLGRAGGDGPGAAQCPRGERQEVPR